MRQDGVFKGSLVGGKHETGEIDYGGKINWQYKIGEGWNFQQSAVVGAPFVMLKVQNANDILSIDFGLQEDWADDIEVYKILKIGVKLNLESSIHFELKKD